MKVIEIEHDAFESFVSKTGGVGKNDLKASGVMRNSMKTVATYP
jgi:hypothetical protein